jgi:transcriptional regulator with XRE-family HTH domain
MTQPPARTSNKLRDALKQARLEAGLTQKDLADRLEISTSMVSQVEGGTRDAIIPVGEAWAKACGAELKIVKQDMRNLSLEGLTPAQAELVGRLAFLLPRLDMMLVLTLESQVRLWEQVIPEEATAVGNEMSRSSR